MSGYFNAVKGYVEPTSNSNSDLGGVKSLTSKSKLIDVVDPSGDGNKFIVDKYEDIVTINTDLANMTFRTLYHLKGLTSNITVGLPAIISDPVNNSDEIWLQDTDSSLDTYTLTIPVKESVLINGEAKPLRDCCSLSY